MTLTAVVGVTTLVPAAQARVRDTDGDGLGNRYERKGSHTNPRRADTDRDGLRDRFELRRSRTSPRAKDTDRDGLRDRFELLRSKTSPRAKDTDRDGLSDGFEWRRYKTSPRRKDSDGDGYPDGLEVLLGRDPLRHEGDTRSLELPVAEPELPSLELPSPEAPSPTAPVPPPLPPVPAPPAPPADVTPPDTVITAGPNGTVDSASASFSFGASEGGSSFECRMDSGAWGACSSPRTYSGLSNGSHTFRVRAKDVAGNTDSTPAVRTWTVNVAGSPPPPPPPPTADFAWSPQNPQNPPVQVSFTSTGTCPAAPCSYRWSHVAYGEFAAGQTALFTYTTASTKNVELHVTDAQGRTASGTHAFQVTVGPAPTAQCANGLDDDGDGLVDLNDAGCSSSTDDDELNVIEPPPTGTGCMADPSDCGFPDVETTGVTPGTTLTPVSGHVRLSTPGMVYENKLVTGSLTVQASNVTIRNVKVVSTDPYYAVRTFGSGSPTGTVLEHVEIDLNGHKEIKGIAFSNYTARHVLFHNGSDCAHFVDNVVIEDSLCVLGPDNDDDGWPDGNREAHRLWCGGFPSTGAEHFDGFQSDGGRNITLRHNTIRNPCSQTSAILMSTNTSPISDVRIQDNLMAGGGYTLYCNAGPDVPNETVTGNRIARTYWEDGGWYGPTSGCADANVFSGNVWDDTGAPL